MFGGGGRVRSGRWWSQVTGNGGDMEVIMDFWPPKQSEQLEVGEG